ncbi:MAG: tape measure protein, partial [Aestuariibacter sp.]|nr:tape measure protein [Aestuariibacter sp.]
MTDIVHLGLELNTRDILEAANALEKFRKAGVAAFTDVKKGNDGLAAALDRTQASIRNVRLDELMRNASGADVAMKKLSVSANDSGLSNVAKAAKSTSTELPKVKTGADSAGAAVKGMGKDAKDAGVAVEKMGNSAKVAFMKVWTGARSTLATLNRYRLSIIATVAAVALSINRTVSLADSYNSMGAMLGTVTNSTEQFSAAQTSLNAVAENSRSSLQSVYSLYTSMAPALSDLGYSQAQMVATTNQIAMSLKLAGGSAEGHRAALIQLTQAMGSGVLRGDEFNSIMENGRGFAIQLAEGLGVPISALRSMAEQGLLTTEVIVTAMAKQDDAITKTFTNLPYTSGQAWTLVMNQVTLAIGRIDEFVDISGTS